MPEPLARGAKRRKLSDKSQLILDLLSRGGSQSIVCAQSGLRPADVAQAALEALALNEAAARGRKAAKLLRRYPRAYERWCPDEEKRVVELYRSGKTLREIAAMVSRQPNSIKWRLQRLGLFS